MQKYLVRFGVASLVAMFASAANAQFFYTDGHSDFLVEFENGEFEFKFESEGIILDGNFVDEGVEYEPSEVVTVVGPNAIQPRPAGAAFDVLGNNAGDDTWIIPEVNPGLGAVIPWVGIGAKDIPLGTLENDQFNLSLDAVNGPGTVTAFASGPNFIWTAPGDSVVFGADQKIHWNISFSELGTYDVTLGATGILADTGAEISSQGTYRFIVTPEPTSLLLLSLAGLVARRR